MKPGPFEYVAPRSIEEAVDVLAARGDDAKVLAGGQSLVPTMNLRLARPAVVVDLGRVTGLDALEERDGGLTIGAMTRQRRVERDPTVRAKWPLLAEAIGYIGHPAIRTRGTVGGSMAHADPAAELPALAMLLNAELRVRGPRGERTIPAEQFFVSYLTTALEPDELLTEVSFPALPSGTGWDFQEVARRFGDFALVAVGVTVTVGDADRCEDARIALVGAGPTPVRAAGAEALMRGQALSDELLEEAARNVSQEIEPDADLHASADYRRRAAGVLTRRTLAQARARATKEATR